MEIAFTITRKIKAPIEIVFDALTNPLILSEFTGEAIISPVIGSPFEMFDGWVNGEILGYEKNRKLSYSWKPNEWDEKSKHSEVSFVFNERGAKTVIELEHKGFPNQDEADSHEKGWEDHVFIPLEQYLGVEN